ncbi:MAG: hypothetical protein IKX44_02665 [Prevotella sp.]|nr:hypothetical protein [Prevotella sp.]
MDKKLYIVPNTKFINPVGEPLMDFNVGGSEAGDDFEFAKDNDLDDNDSWSSGSVWED